MQNNMIHPSPRLIKENGHFKGSIVIHIILNVTDTYLYLLSSGEYFALALHIICRRKEKEKEKG